MLRELPTLAVCVAAGAMYGAPAHSLEWHTGHSVTAGAGSESNIALSTTNPVSVQSATASVAASLIAQRPGLSFALQPEVRALRYADDAKDDRNDLFASFGLNHRRLRESIGFNAHYARESTLTSEFETSGLFGVDVERVQRGADASYSRALGARHSLAIAASDVETVYGESPLPTFADYGVRSLELRHTTVTSERSSRSLVARESLVDAPARDGTSTTRELQATWSLRLAPHLQGSFGVGAFVVDTSSREPEDPSASLNLALSQQWARWTLSTSLARGVRAQTGGTVVVEDSVGVAAARRLSERLDVGLQLRGARSSFAIERLLDFDRTYSLSGATLNWKMARRISLAASVYERTEYTTFTPRASSLESFVSLTYRSG